MRVAITGATGNVGTSLLEALAPDDRIESIVGIARRVPSARFPKTTWHRADVSVDDLRPVLRDVDAVVHLAWLIQPSRDLAAVERTNVGGSERVFQAAGDAAIKILVCASSVGTYAKGPKDRAVDETWPASGIQTSFYSRHKAEVERLLTRFEGRNPQVRTVRLRPGLTFKRQAASEIRRYFAGPLVPSFLLRRGLIPFVPDLNGLKFQAAHASDVAEAYRLALTKEVRGAFNIAADPVLDAERLGRLLRARPIRVPPRLARAVVSATWKLHLQPTPPGWIDMALQAPIMDTSRARTELGWSPRHTSEDAFQELFEGMRESAGFTTAPLQSPRKMRSPAKREHLSP